MTSKNPPGMSKLTILAQTNSLNRMKDIAAFRRKSYNLIFQEAIDDYLEKKKDILNDYDTLFAKLENN